MLAAWPSLPPPSSALPSTSRSAATIAGPAFWTTPHAGYRSPNPTLKGRAPIYIGPFGIKQLAAHKHKKANCNDSL